MPYCTLADLRAIASEEDLIQLTDDNGVGVVDQTRTNRAITDAGELIDGYLRGRYTLPLNPVPGLLVTLAADIARYRLYALRPSVDTPEVVADSYKNALRILEQIQKGVISLGIASPAQDVPATGGPQYVAGERVFTRESLGDY